MKVVCPPNTDISKKTFFFDFQRYLCLLCVFYISYSTLHFYIHVRTCILYLYSIMFYPMDDYMSVPILVDKSYDCSIHLDRHHSLSVRH